MSESVINLPTAPSQRREIQNVVDAVPILDTARFEHMQRVARVMASSSMIPETLRTVGPRDNKQDLPFEQVLSNCFLVVNQAARWGMDPFSVISCCSVVHGRLAYEGKLVAAVLDAKLNLSLHHYFTGDAGTDGYRIYLCDHPFTADLIERLKPSIDIPGLRLWDGSVGEWKTTGTGTPWTPKNYRRMLIYRGTRDWTRIYESALMLGVYSDDEMLDLMEDARARRATPVSSISLADRLTAAKAGTSNHAGFSVDHIDRESQGTADTEAQREAGNKSLPQASTGDEPLASDRVASADAPEGVQDRMNESTPSPISNSSEQPTAPQPPTQTDAPEAQSAPAPASGEPSGESMPGPGVDQGDGDDASTASSPSLPEGWGITYATALRRAQKPASLEKLAGQWWANYGGWDRHKHGPDAPTAAAIFNAFKNNFGNKDAIDAELRELI